jgi:hypothetical protein
VCSGETAYFDIAFQPVARIHREAVMGEDISPTPRAENALKAPKRILRLFLVRRFERVTQGEGVVCRWCGKPIVSPRAWLCGECNKPARAPAYVLAAIQGLLLPLILAFATFWLSSGQQQIALNIANRQKLADAYVGFGATMTDYRRAVATIQVFATDDSNDTVSFPELRKAVLDYDAAFNAIGAKLGPFEEAARRIHNEAMTKSWIADPLQWFSGKGQPRTTIEISKTWNSCFVAPYYGTSAVPREKTYWYKILQTFKSCTLETCKRTVAVQISDILEDVFSGSCVCENPAKQRSLVWFYPEIEAVTEGGFPVPDATAPGDPLIRPSNEDLAKTAPSCQTQ